MVISKVVTKGRGEEVITVVAGVATKEAVEAGIKELVAIMVVEVRDIREVVVHIMEIKVDNTKMAVIIKALKEVMPMNMTIEGKAGDRIVGTRKDITECKGLVRRKILNMTIEAKLEDRIMDTRKDIAECKGLVGRKSTKTILRFSMFTYRMFIEIYT